MNVQIHKFPLFQLSSADPCDNLIAQLHIDGNTAADIAD